MEKKNKMNNKMLSVFGNFHPYFKELRPLAGSVVGCILMQRLDFWFAMYPGGFYKFMAPVVDKINEEGGVESGHPAYKKGQSWCEDIGCTIDEFRSAFDKIGVRYPSMGDYKNQEGDKFKGKFYLSYLDRKSNITHYLRNHKIVDDLLNQLAAGQLENPPTIIPTPPTLENPSTEMGDDHPPTLENPSTDIGKAGVPFKVIKEVMKEVMIKEREHARSEKTDSSFLEMQNQKLLSSSTPAFKQSVDKKTGAFLKVQDDADLLVSLVKRYGEESVKNAAAEAKILTGKGWLSEIAKLLKPEETRGNKLSKGKWSDFDKKDYMKGVGGAEKNFSF